MPSRSRTGKIAMLPAAVREELNQRIADGEQAPELLPWLNGLPEVRRILAERFEEMPVSPQNLCSWRRGGYKDWLFARRHAEDTHKLTELAIAEAKAGGLKILESAAAVASLQTLRLLSELAALNRAAGGPDGGGDREGSSPEGDRRRVGARPEAGVAVPPPSRTRDGDPVVVDANECLLAGRVQSVAPAQPPAAGAPSAGGGADEDGEEHYSLTDRFNLLDKATTSIARLRKLNHAESSLQLRRDHEAQALRIHSEKLEFKLRVHEDRMELLKTPPDDKAAARPDKVSLTPDGRKQIEVVAKLL